MDIAVVAGLRTPFVKADGPLRKVPAQELGRTVAAELPLRLEMRPDDIDQVVIGNVGGPLDAANVARVIALSAGVPADRPAHTVNRNCASGIQSITEAYEQIARGEAVTVLAGGTESMSNYPLVYGPRASERFRNAARAKGFWARTAAGAGLLSADLIDPVAAVKLGLTDPVSGMIMGQTAEVLAAEFGVSRAEQDRFALQSHQRACKAIAEGFFADEITPVFAANGRYDAVAADVGPRAEQSMEALGKLAPFFDRDHGTVTVGNSCPITDGAAAVLMMPADAARARGFEPLGVVRAYAFAGLDPARMGLGPVFAAAKLMAKTGLDLKDVDLFEINEAFAAQVLAVVRAFGSAAFAEKHFGRDRALGEIPEDRLNVNGGAIALGHPVGVSGTRIVLTLLRELRRRNLKRGLAMLCVGGGQGAAVLVER
jgi:acetyl-CoA C-acetyltransferase/acetyl-CoA acyltransferase